MKPKNMLLRVLRGMLYALVIALVLTVVVGAHSKDIQQLIHAAKGIVCSGHDPKAASVV